MAQKTKRSPLKVLPRRYAGDSLHDELENVREGAFRDVFLVVVLTGAMLLAALLVWLLRIPPVVFVVIALLYFVAALVWALPRLRAVRQRVQRLALGRDGERAVADHLDALREDGYRVYHDLQGEGFNIDHVLVGPTGVYTLETKTISKLVGRNQQVRFDGESLRFGEARPDRDPVAQARAQAAEVKRLLGGSLDRRIWVRPVVLVPGWYVDRSVRALKDVWVLEPKAFVKWVANESVRLEPNDIERIAAQLEPKSRHR